MMKKEKKLPYFIYVCIVIGVSLTSLILMLIFAAKQKTIIFGICLTIIDLFLIIFPPIYNFLPREPIGVPKKHEKLFHFISIFMKFVAVSLFVLVIVQTMKGIVNLIDIFQEIDKTHNTSDSIVGSLETNTYSDFGLILWIVEAIIKALFIYAIEIFVMVFCSIIKFDPKSESVMQENHPNIVSINDKQIN